MLNYNHSERLLLRNHREPSFLGLFFRKN